MPTKRVLRFLSIAAIAPLLLTSCDSTGGFDPIDDAAGTYELSIYADNSVPITFNCAPGECGLSNGGTFRVNDGTLILYEDGTFTETNHYTTTPNGGSAQATTFVSTGVYEIFGDEIELFAPAQNGIGSRTLFGSFIYGGNDVRLRYTEDGEQYEYRR